MKSFNNHVKYVSFILKEKHGNILKNVMKYGIGFKILLKKVLIFQVFLNDKYIATKRKSYENEIGTVLWFQYAADFITLTDSGYRSDESYFPQAFLEKCQFKYKKNTIKIFFTIYLTDSDSSSDFDSEDTFNHKVEPFADRI